MSHNMTDTTILHIISSYMNNKPTNFQLTYCLTIQFAESGSGGYDVAMSGRLTLGRPQRIENP